MKKLFLITLYILLSMPVIAEDTIYLNEKWDKEASKQLYEYLCRIHDKSFLELANITEDVCVAQYYDLNSDKENEIIGFVNSSAYQGTAGHGLFILKKNIDKTYTDLAFLVNFYVVCPVKILDTKTAGFFDINLYGNKQDKPIDVKYDKIDKCYKYFFPN